MTRSEDYRRLAEADAALDARRPRPVRQELPLTDAQRLEIVRFHRNLLIGIGGEMPLVMADGLARGFSVVNHYDEDAVRIVREGYPDDDARIDKLAARLKASGAGIYSRRKVKTRGGRRQTGAGDSETAAVKH